MRDFINTMKGLSNPNRVKIIKLLQRQTLFGYQITEAIGLSQSTTSNHLKILVDAGLIFFTKEELRVRYRLAGETTNPYAATLLGNLRHWLEKEPDVVATVARLAED